MSGAALRVAEIEAAGMVEPEPWWSLIRLTFSSPARLAMLQAQDVLGLGSDARMNIPGRATGSWRWRMAPGALTCEHAKRLRAATEESGGWGDAVLRAIQARIAREWMTVLRSFSAGSFCAGFILQRLARALAQERDRAAVGGDHLVVLDPGAQRLLHAATRMNARPPSSPWQTNSVGASLTTRGGS